MLDKRTGALLFQINALCKEGGYKIVEERELFACFSSQSEDREELSRTLAFLQERKYIDIRYAEDGVFCLCPLPDGRLYFENVLRERSEETRRRRSVFLLTAFGAFLGSLAGALIVWVAVLIGVGV